MSIRKKLVILIGGLLVLLSFIILYQVYRFSIPCVFHEITGFYCPGCGMTRAFMSIVHLDFYQAIRYNAFSIIVFMSCFIYGGYSLINWLKDKPNTIMRKIPSYVWYLCLILLLTYGILRNINYFSWLAPITV